MQLALIFSFILPLAACLPATVKNDDVLHTVYSPDERSYLGPMELAQFNFKDYVLNGVCLDCTRQTLDELFDCNFKFSWEDPNYNQSTSCTTRFHWDGITLQQGPKNDYDTENVVCSVELPDFWQFKFGVMKSLWDFNMTLSRAHKDTEKYGQWVPEFFAAPNVTLVPMGKTDYSMIFALTAPLYAKIVGMSM
ncbi:hypothetical protein BJ170DRAFT_394312 [Xylariales sp. AK1849]|nr:hypothetical protein BJ170DRAFT_394312 [Xylariales sp. AK1849]